MDLLRVAEAGIVAVHWGQSKKPRLNVSVRFITDPDMVITVNKSVMIRKVYCTGEGPRYIPMKQSKNSDFMASGRRLYMRGPCLSPSAADEIW